MAPALKTGLALILLMSSLMFMAFLSGGVLAQSPYPELFIELDLRFETPSKGEMTFFMGNNNRDHLVLNLTDRPELGELEDENIQRAFEYLFGTDTDDTAMLNRILDGGIDPHFEGVNISYKRDEIHIGVLVQCHFSFDHTNRRAEYRYLSYLEPFQLPLVKRNDPGSLANYNNVLKQFSKIRIAISIQPPSGANMDLQWDGAYHYRTKYAEGVSFRSDLVGFIGNGHKFTISDERIFSTTMMFYLSIASTIAGSVLTAVAWIRKNFKNWALIFPAGALILFPGPGLFFFRPYLNPYGLYDAGLIMISALFIGYSIAINFAPTGVSVKKRPVIEQQEKVHYFEMPNVIYVDRPVYLKGADGSKGDRRYNPYVVLGVDRSASMQEVEAAYRRMVLKYHPDKVQNAPDWVGELAEERIKGLNRAHEEIMKERGKTL